MKENRFFINVVLAATVFSGSAAVCSITATDFIGINADHKVPSYIPQTWGEAPIEVQDPNTHETITLNISGADARMLPNDSGILYRQWGNNNVPDAIIWQSIEGIEDRVVYEARDMDGRLFSLEVSPSGDHFAVVEVDINNNSISLDVHSIDGQLERSFHLQNFYDREFRWTRDNRLVLVTPQTGNFSEEVPYTVTIYDPETDGTWSESFLRSAPIPTISPDGEYIAFSMDDDWGGGVFIQRLRTREVFLQQMPIAFTPNELDWTDKPGGYTVSGYDIFGNERHEHFGVDSGTSVPFDTVLHAG